MTRPEITDKGTVFLVDDDIAVRRGVTALLSAAEYSVETSKSAEDFLSKLSSLDLSNAVLLVDICMPGIQGLELQELLKDQNIELPVIVMTAHGDVPMAVRAMRNGAVDFLEKPFTVVEVKTALDRALSMSRLDKTPLQSPEPALLDKFEKLTPREEEVLRGIVDGNTNKEIARVLDVSPRTVEAHRQKIMLKMGAASFAELIRMAIALNIDGNYLQ